MAEEIINEATVKEKAKIVNQGKKLYREECCTYFQMNDTGEWEKIKRFSADEVVGVAEEVAESFLVCTCGRPLAVKVKHQTVIGEYLALR